MMVCFDVLSFIFSMAADRVPHDRVLVPGQPRSGPIRHDRLNVHDPRRRVQDRDGSVDVLEPAAAGNAAEPSQVRHDVVAPTVLRDEGGRMAGQTAICSGYGRSKLGDHRTDRPRPSRGRNCGCASLVDQSL